MSKKPKPYFIVLEDGVPCEKQPQYGLFETGLCPRSGVPMKNADSPQRFAGEKSAAQAITKTQNLAQRLRESVVSDWPKIQCFINRGKFTVQKSIPQA